MLSDGVNLLHENTHIARKTQELLLKLKWEVSSYPQYIPDLASNLLTKYLSLKRLSSDSDVKTIAENWLNGQGGHFFKAEYYNFCISIFTLRLIAIYLNAKTRCFNFPSTPNPPLIRSDN
ncbi:hypothetical protein AVEN_36577-1 [Araneus ventricosus]|uniref:Uncharacterized protein n=1 Tax=Araneus ventricosus TaxID=182803 RepID=A0A4Y1ZX31_ARAVE|nr:hypothetical protein AVEN_36577-1 [Araneus ventricosus]